MATKEDIAELMGRARKAQAIAEKYTQEEVRHYAKCIGWFALNKTEEWAEILYAETRLGNIESKIAQMTDRARGLVRDLSIAKSVGVVEVDEAKQLIKIAKPVGVIGSLVPTTVPIGVIFSQAMNAMVARDAIIFSPHPRAMGSSLKAVGDLRELYRRMGVPEDLILCIDAPTIDKTEELMRECDLVIATGGAPMVKAAYSSGTPAFGVGAGNVAVVIDETADLDDAAKKVEAAQLNDLATGCSTENSMVIQKDIYGDAMKAMVSHGAYICNSEEKAKLQSVLWKDGRLSLDVICRPATTISELAGFTIPKDRTWLIVEETEYGNHAPFSKEKLSVIVAAYKYNEFDDAIDLVNGIQSFSGAGHSCGIHSFDEERIMKYALGTKTCRVAVRATVGKSNSGNFNNGMPFTYSIGCGTWGGNITSENITYKNYINTTWVAREIPNFKVPTDEELFGDIMKDKETFKGLF